MDNAFFRFLFILAALGLSGTMVVHVMSILEMKTGEFVWIVFAPSLLFVMITVIRAVSSSSQRKRMNWFMVRMPISDYWKHAPKWLRLLALFLVVYGLGIFTYLRATLTRGMADMHEYDVFAISSLAIFLYGISIVGLFPAKEKQSS